MTAVDKPISEIDRSDIFDLCDEKPAEGVQFEIKEDLPAKDGRTVYQGGSVPDYARNAIAAEIVAFANTYGGTLLIGIRETEDKPHRPDAVSALPHCSELAHRLRQAIYDVIDPPLPQLESRGVVTADDGHEGVVLLRVGSSTRAPHRLTSNKEAYVRREDETVRVGMREIQDLTIRRLTEVRGANSPDGSHHDQLATQLAFTIWRFRQPMWNCKKLLVNEKCMQRQLTLRSLKTTGA